MADAPLTPDAYLVYAKGSRRYWVVTLKPDEVPEIYKGGETVPLYRATPDADLPEGVTPGSWGDLKLQMEASAWDGSLRLEDALANIDEFMARAPSPPVAAPAEPVVFVSPRQAMAHTDPDDPIHGRYLPARKTSAGMFTMPLYAAPQPPRHGTAPLSDEQIGEICELYVKLIREKRAGHIDKGIDAGADYYIGDVAGYVAHAVNEAAASRIAELEAENKMLSRSLDESLFCNVQGIAERLAVEQVGHPTTPTPKD